MSPETWLAFALASAIAVVIPGPVVVFVVTRAAAGGWRAVLPTAAGVALGDGIALLVSLLGLGAVLVASAALFTAVKWLGAAYLVWLGVTLWRAPAEAPPPLPARRAFRDAFVVTVLNPKSIGFFVAFLPQFVDPARPLAPQGALLLATFVGLGTLNVLAYAGFATRLGAAIRAPGVRRWMNRAGGGAMVGAGIATALARR